MELLTPYALQFVVKQLGFVTKVKIVGQTDDYFTLWLIITKELSKLQLPSAFVHFINQCSVLGSTFLLFVVI